MRLWCNLDRAHRVLTLGFKLVQVALQGFYLHLLLCECFFLLAVYFAKPGVVPHLFIALLYAQVCVAKNMVIEIICLLLGESIGECCCVWFGGLRGFGEVVLVWSTFTFLFGRAEEGLVTFKLDFRSLAEEVVVADDSFVFFANLQVSDNASLLQNKIVLLVCNHSAAAQGCGEFRLLFSGNFIRNLAELLFVVVLFV